MFNKSNTIVTKILSRILLGLVVLGFSSSAFAFKAAYIDMQKAIQSTKAGKSAKTKLEAEFKKKSADLKKKEEKIKKEAEDFQKKAAVYSDTVRAEKQDALRKKMMAFQQELGQSQTNIQKKEREMTKPILDKIQQVIGKVAKEKGFSMIFEKAEHSVMWADNALDITDTVVKKFEKL